MTVRSLRMTVGADFAQVLGGVCFSLPFDISEAHKIFDLIEESLTMALREPKISKSIATRFNPAQISVQRDMMDRGTVEPGAEWIRNQLTEENMQAMDRSTAHLIASIMKAASMDIPKVLMEKAEAYEASRTRGNVERAFFKTGVVGRDMSYVPFWTDDRASGQDLMLRVREVYTLAVQYCGFKDDNWELGEAIAPNGNLDWIPEPKTLKRRAAEAFEDGYKVVKKFLKKEY